MKKAAALFILAIQLHSAAFAAGVPATLAAGESLPPHAESFGLGAANDGSILRQRQDDASGAVEIEKVEREAFRRIAAFLLRLPLSDPQGGMALALKSYLAPRMDPREVDNNIFLKRTAGGQLRLTKLGYQALFDIITARDGALIEPIVELKPSVPTTQASAGGSAAWAEPGALAAFDAAEFAGASPARAFDGARHSVGSFDWNGLETAVTAAGGLTSAGSAAPAAPAMLEGYAVDRERNTVRVIVAASRTVASDRFKMRAEDGAEVLREAGLDAQLFERSGAKVVRAVDNLVTVDVPLPQAAALGLSLEARGVESRPARVFRAAAEALAGPAGSLLGAQFLPVPSAPLVGAVSDAARKAAEAKMVDALSTLRAGELWDAGMKGRGTLVGVIDSGIDPTHPDFKDKSGNSRIEEYLDFTEEGKDDVVGHGTHVSGTIGGTGAASEGRFAGLAPETRFKVAKVFGVKGETDESVILAAMKWMADAGKDGKAKVDVLNMSLGGPGEPNKDPLGSMANHLVVDKNILVVAAAGNEGAAGMRTVGTPGNARYALTVSGVNKDGEFPFFVSKGPAAGEDGDLYNKPDVSAIAGDVDLSKLEQSLLQTQLRKDEQAEPPTTTAAAKPEGMTAVAGPALNAVGCVYAPGGVIAPRSSKDPDGVCGVDGAPAYRYMSGTSMATPMVAGMSADVIGYLKDKGVRYDAFQVRALVMETARDLGKGREQQGTGLVDGKRLAQTVADRVSRGLPVGNVAFALSTRMTVEDQGRIKDQTRYAMTPLGLLDTRTGRLINNEKDFKRAVEEIHRTPKLLMVNSNAIRQA
ncbi:MAG: S8 family serine peptidase [Elusimicrobiota bacterium]